MTDKKNNQNLQYNNTTCNSKICSTKSSKLPFFSSVVSYGQNTSVMKFLLIGIIALLIFSLTAAPVSAAWDGTNNSTWYNPSNPSFTISTEADLAGLAYLVNGGTDFSDKTITLGADLDLLKSDGITKNLWTPIGTDSNPFKGTFDGSNYNISNLYINNLSAEHQGLFGYTDISATIKNLGLINVDIIGFKDIGGLVGINEGGKIENCYVTGTVMGDINVGGLVGYNHATCPGTAAAITNSYASGEVKGKDCVGGLVGRNYAYYVDSSPISYCNSSITYCYATGDVTVTHTVTDTNYEPNVGGLVGYNHATGLRVTAAITNCYATGNVTIMIQGVDSNIKTYVGGLVGCNRNGAVTNCYATGNIDVSMIITVTVTGTYFENNVGGLVGLNWGEYSAAITNCYATGNAPLIVRVIISGTNSYRSNNYVGGLAGMNRITIEGFSKALITKSVALNPSVSGSSDIGRVAGCNENGIISDNYARNDMKVNFVTVGEDLNKNGNGKELSDLKTESTYNDELGWDFSDIWIMGGSVDNSCTKYPILKWQTKTITFDSNGRSPDNFFKNVMPGTTVTEPADPTRIGHIFEGWYLTQDGTGTVYDFTKPVTSDITLYAKWKQRMYNVTFNNNTGIGIMANQTIGEGMTAILNESTYSKDGYNFAGWNKTDINGTTVDYPDKAEITMESSDINLFAVWVIKPSPAPTKSSSGSTDTGSGHYSDYPRNVPESGYVSFDSSPTVTGVIFPKGTTGSTSLHIPTSDSLEYKEIVLSLTNDKGEKEIISLFEITAPDTKGETSKIYFKVKLIDIKYGFDTKDVKMYHRLNDGTWEALGTFLVEEKDGYAYYYSETESFSPFAIIYEEDGATEVGQPAVTPVKTQTAEPVSPYVEPTIPTTVPTNEQTKSPIGLLGLGLGLLGAAVILRRK